MKNLTVYIVAFLVGFCLFFITVNAFAYSYDDAKKESRIFTFDGTLVSQAQSDFQKAEPSSFQKSETDVLYGVMQKLIQSANIITSDDFQKLLQKSNEENVKVTVKMEEE